MANLIIYCSVHNMIFMVLEISMLSDRLIGRYSGEKDIDIVEIEIERDREMGEREREREREREI